MLKEILSNLKSKVLKGCHIVFSGLIPLNTPVTSSEVWRSAQAYGAKCFTDLKPSVTHLVAAKAGTGKVNQVLNSNIYLVNPSWLYDSWKLWVKADEHQYSVDGLPVHSNNRNNGHFERAPKKMKTEEEEREEDQHVTSPYSHDLEEELSDQEMATLLEQEFEEVEK